MNWFFKCLTVTLLGTAFFFTWEHIAWGAIGCFLAAILSSNEIGEE